MTTSSFSWILIVTVAAVLQQQSVAQPYSVRTIAGVAGMSGTTDGTNDTARFRSPAGLAADAAGNVYAVDGNAIRRISASGTNWVVTTIAGTSGTHGTSDGTNSAALFDYPQAITVDGGGNLYVADTYNNAIRKVSPFGTNWVVTTIAGLAGKTNNAAVDGTNSSARFDNPYGLTVDSRTNIYVADTVNYTIRKVAPVGTNWVVTTLAGMAGSIGGIDGTNNAARVAAPFGIAVDNDGTLFVADFGSNTVRQIKAFGTNWVVTTLAGAAGAIGSADGLGSAARFNQPQGLAVDATHYICVADAGNGTIRRISPAGLVSTVAGLAGPPGSVDGVGTAARFNWPYGLATDANRNIFVADNGNFTVRQGRGWALLQVTLAGSRPVLSWPLGLTGFLPEVSAALPAGSWSQLPTNGLTTSGANYLLTSSWRWPKRTITSPGSPQGRGNDKVIGLRVLLHF